MRYFLPQALINLCSGIMTARLQRKIRKHTGIPNTASRSLTKKGIVTNVKAVTIRTGKGADTATQAGGRHLCPEISIVKNRL